METKLLRGTASKREIVKLKLRLQGKPPGYYEKLAQDLDYREIEELVQVSIKEKNLNALRGLAELNRAAVSSKLEDALGYELIQEATEKGSEIAPELFFLVRGVLTPHYKQLFKNLTKLVILKQSRKVAGRGLKGWHRLHTRYIPYKTDIDIPRTILNIAGKPIEHMSISDLAGIEKVQKRKAGVLILDTSGSMYGRLIFNAALTAAVLSYHMRDNEHAIVLFNTNADVMKKMTEKKEIDTLLDNILETQASGFTNITAGLRRGLVELKKARSTFKFAILITDGNANRDVEELESAATNFSNLHVIAIPSETHNVGVRNLERIARLGKGTFVKVDRFKDIPRALQRLLMKI